MNLSREIFFCVIFFSYFFIFFLKMGGSAHLSFSMGALMAAGGAFAFASMLTFTFVSLPLYQTLIFWHTSADIFARVVCGRQ